MKCPGVMLPDDNAAERDPQARAFAVKKGRETNIGLDAAQRQRAPAIDRKAEFRRQVVHRLVPDQQRIQNFDQRARVDQRGRIETRERARHDIAHGFGARIGVEQAERGQFRLQGSGMSSTLTPRICRLARAERSKAPLP